MSSADKDAHLVNLFEQITALDYDIGCEIINGLRMRSNNIYHKVQCIAMPEEQLTDVMRVKNRMDDVIGMIDPNYKKTSYSY